MTTRIKLAYLFQDETLAWRVAAEMLDKMSETISEVKTKVVKQRGKERWRVKAVVKDYRNEEKTLWFDCIDYKEWTSD